MVTAHLQFSYICISLIIDTRVAHLVFMGMLIVTVSFDRKQYQWFANKELNFSSVKSLKNVTLHGGIWTVWLYIYRVHFEFRFNEHCCHQKVFKFKLIILWIVLIFFSTYKLVLKKKVRHKVKGKSTWFYKIFWGFFLSAWKLFWEFSDIPCSSNIMQDKMILTSNISKSSPSTGVTNLLTTSQNLYL